PPGGPSPQVVAVGGVRQEEHEGARPERDPHERGAVRRAPRVGDPVEGGVGAAAEEGHRAGGGRRAHERNLSTAAVKDSESWPENSYIGRRPNVRTVGSGSSPPRSAKGRAGWRTMRNCT